MKDIKINKLKISVEPLSVHHHWKLTKEIKWYSKRYNIIVRVPEGFMFDGCSIPRLLRNIIPVTGKKLVAGAIHDYLYRTAQLTREQADWCLFDALNENEVSNKVSNIMYYSVKKFGKRSWNNHRKND